MYNPLALISPANFETSLVDFCYYFCDSRCCNSIFLLPDEYYNLKINNLIDKNNSTIINMVKYYILGADENTGKCRFLKNNLCSIQELKPIDCKVWPLYFRPGKNAPNILSCDSNCPISKSLPERFIIAAIKELNKIPEKLQKDFYHITKLSGYKLGNIDIVIIVKKEVFSQKDYSPIINNENKKRSQLPVFFELLQEDSASNVSSNTGGNNAGI